MFRHVHLFDVLWIASQSINFRSLFQHLEFVPFFLLLVSHSDFWVEPGFETDSWLPDFNTSLVLWCFYCCRLKHCSLFSKLGFLFFHNEVVLVTMVSEGKCGWSGLGLTSPDLAYFLFYLIIFERILIFLELKLSFIVHPIFGTSYTFSSFNHDVDTPLSVVLALFNSTFNLLTPHFRFIFLHFNFILFIFVSKLEFVVHFAFLNARQFGHLSLTGLLLSIKFLDQIFTFLLFLIGVHVVSICKAKRFFYFLNFLLPFCWSGIPTFQLLFEHIWYYICRFSELLYVRISCFLQLIHLLQCLFFLE